MTVQPWERQSQESAKAFSAFELYLQQCAERSIRKVAQELNKSVALIARWSRRHGWVQRAREWDTFQAAEKTRQLLTKEVDSRLRRARHGEFIESTGMRAVQAIAAEVVAGTRQLSVSEAAQLAAVGSRMDREAVQSAPGVSVNLGVNVGPSDQIDPLMDDELAIKVATCYVDRWMKRYPGRSLPAMYQGETVTREQREAEITRALREGGRA